jgi:hypothetical protein
MNELTILLVVILFPGVLLTVVYDNYAEHKPWDSFKYILYSIVSGFITYAVLQIVIFSFQFLYNIKGHENTVWYVLSVWDFVKKSPTFEIHLLEILSAGFMGIVLGLISVKITQLRIINNILIKIGVTNKYGDDSVYVKTIEDLQDDWVRVIILDENMSFEGRIHCYHDNAQLLEISLKEVIVYETSTATKLYETDLLYISKEHGKFLIYKT